VESDGDILARHSSGWIKLYRSAIDSDLTDNKNLWCIWTWLLGSASWHESSLHWNGERKVLPPGTVVCGISELAAFWDISKSVVSHWLNYLVRSERITIETGTKGTIITILNWKEYQARDEAAPNEVRTEPEREPNASRTPVVTYEEVKKERSVCVEAQTNTQTAERQKPDLSRLEAVFETWKGTLKHFKIVRDNLTDDEKQAIARAVQRHGVEIVDMALYGARYEAKTENFDPGQHVSIQRVLKPDRNGVSRLDKFANLGAANKASASRPMVYDPKTKSYRELVS